MKQRHYVLVAAVIVLTIVVMKLPARTATQFRLAIASLFLPLFGLSSSTQQLAEKAGNAVVPRKELLKQNDELHLENAELRIQLEQMAELDRENARLRALVEFQARSPRKLRAAHIIARDPANWWRNVRIDLGKRDGLRIDLPVLSPTGYLVGRLSEVSDNFARVALIGDANCKVPAAVWDIQPGKRGQPQTSTIVDKGVITAGASVLDENVVELSFLSKAGDVKSGHLVATSQESAIFPPGIPIGQVIDTRTIEFGLQPVARVKLAVKMNLLDEVFVIMP